MERTSSHCYIYFLIFVQISYAYASEDNRYDCARLFPLNLEERERLACENLKTSINKRKACSEAFQKNAGTERLECLYSRADLALIQICAKHFPTDLELRDRVRCLATQINPPLFQACHDYYSSEYQSYDRFVCLETKAKPKMIDRCKKRKFTNGLGFIHCLEGR
jgi:hypothetical protein